MVWMRNLGTQSCSLHGKAGDKKYSIIKNELYLDHFRIARWCPEGLGQLIKKRGLHPEIATKPLVMNFKLDISQGKPSVGRFSTLT